MTHNEMATRVNDAKSRGRSKTVVYCSKKDIVSFATIIGSSDYQYQETAGFDVNGYIISWSPTNYRRVPVEPTDFILQDIRDVLEKSDLQLGAHWDSTLQVFYISLRHGNFMTVRQIQVEWGCQDWPYLQRRLREQPHIDFQVYRDDFP